MLDDTLRFPTIHSLPSLAARTVRCLHNGLVMGRRREEYPSFESIVNFRQPHVSARRAFCQIVALLIADVRPEA